MQEDRTSAMALWTEAASYRNAARCLCDEIARERLKLPYPDPILFLIGHSLEVILKARLRAHGSTLKQLIELSHGLEELIDEVEKDRPPILISHDERDHIRLLDSLHGKRPFRTRYPITGYVQHPDHEILISVVDRLVELTKSD